MPIDAETAERSLAVHAIRRERLGVTHHHALAGLTDDRRLRSRLLEAADGCARRVSTLAQAAAHDGVASPLPEGLDASLAELREALGVLLDGRDLPGALFAQGVLLEHVVREAHLGAAREARLLGGLELALALSGAASAADGRLAASILDLKMSWDAQDRLSAVARGMAALMPVLEQRPMMDVLAGPLRRSLVELEIVPALESGASTAVR